ncbi:glycosyltransferase family 10 domain-containing protein [Mucilaginibacter sp. UYCu711]|uniref:glycosyltransferase family 10 domain-containing protein n=1 Tax=Mucilaginibacter sp. UYCu711 TaxID=3156339 RepID=UPI003D1F00BF
MIKIIWLSNGSVNFADDISVKYLSDNGIFYTDKILLADIILFKDKSKRYKIYSYLFFLKKMMIWTNEPYFETTDTKFYRIRRTIMNVYSQNVFVNNLHFLGSYHENSLQDLGIDIKSSNLKLMTKEIYDNKHKFCVAIYGYHDPNTSDIFINDNQVSLRKYRQDLAFFLYKKGKADIIGNRWPKEVVTTEKSGFQNGDDKWCLRKIEIMKDYKYNVCIENTAFPNYCTEKIWHSILSGCLPIYYGKGTNIYNNFESNSFIDSSEFTSFEELLIFLETLSLEEYINRFNKCYNSFINSWKERERNHNSKYEIIDEFIKEIKYLSGQSV